MKTALCYILLSIFCLNFLSAEIFPVPQGDFNPCLYQAFRPVDTIVVDGNLTEESWQKAIESELFSDIEGDLKPRPYFDTRVKLLWDDTALYIAADMQETDIWAKLTERDAVVFFDNDFEVFIDPDGDTHDYYELEVNALGTLWDLFIIRPYRDRLQVAVNSWDVRGIEYAIGLDGTLNDPSDTDRAWRVEMKIPLSVLAECAHKPVPPRDGDYWRLNFSRVQWERGIDHSTGNYVKLPQTPEKNWVWSPQGLVAMHYPERWGYLFFSQKAVGTSLIDCAIPPVEYEKEYLRQLYYKQKQYWFDHGKYARSLRQLNATALLRNGKKVNPRIEVISQDYIITLPGTSTQPDMYIRGDGLLWQKGYQH